MRLLPRSLTGRLLATAGVAIAVALFFAALAIGQVLERFVMHGLDDRLDAQIAVVARSVAPDGTIDPALATDLPPYDRAGSGWAWQVIAPNRTLRSGSLGPADLPLPPDWNSPPREDHDAHRHHRPWHDPARPRPLDGVDESGRQIHYRIVSLPTAAGPVSVIAAGPRDIVERPWRAAMAPLLVSLLLLGSFLALALIIQLRIGLRPLNRLTALLADVREGRLRHIDVDEPTELLPLVEQLNALIDTNERALERARGHVANLAHGLKTPLATLRLDLDHPRIDPDGRLGKQVARMEGQIRHHLGRARAAEVGDAGVVVALDSCIEDLTQAMARIHEARAIEATIDVPAALAVRCDPQDLDELLGNLLDNAWCWARSAVRLSAREAGRQVSIVIADDGPGMSDRDIAEAMIKGRRLDEREGGHGFGLAISRELVELHGGSLDLGCAELGGLEVRIRLPRGR